MLRKKEAHRRNLPVGLVIVIERSNRHAAFAIARELTDLDDCLRVTGNQQLGFALCDFLANPFDFFEDRVGFGDLFFTWVFCTRTG